VSIFTTSRGHLPELDGATVWLNSPPLTRDGLRGKVVLVNFCTYTCINWLRQLPYVRAWAERYEDKGLVVIGAHTPEFSFEHDVDNVREAIAAMRIEYPIAVDNDYAVWDAFANRYWPALYFVDSTGRIRHERFGEGDYEGSERVIRELLSDAGGHDLGPPAGTVEGEGIEAAADWDTLESSETYLGFERTSGFASHGGLVPRERHTYEIPERLGLNHWALAGDWTARRDAVVVDEAGGALAFRFRSRDVHLVMGPSERGGSARFRVRIGGRPAGVDHGDDADADGIGTVDEQRLYQLVRRRGPITEETFEVSFDAPGIGAYAFTFG
jgi:thiol-disulfide isomerase/thioredoxin